MLLTLMVMILILFLKNFEDDFTISFWMKTTQDGGGTIGEWYTGGVGLVDGDVPGYQNDMGIALTQDRISFGVGWTGEWTALINSTSSVNTGNWVYVAVTRTKSDGKMRLYINGALEQEGVGPANTLDASSLLTVGQIMSSTAAGNQYVGQLDDLKIYNRELSAEDINNYYLVNILNAPPTLVGYYSFENNFDNSQKDVFEDANPHVTYIDEASKYEPTLTYTDGVQGYSANFDGNDTYIIPKKNFEDDFSISFWMKTSQDGGGTIGEWYTGVGLVDGDVSGAQNDMGIALTQDRISFGVGWSGDWTALINSTSSVNTGNWVYVAVTRTKSDGKMRLYINGALEQEGSGPTNTLDATSQLTVGQIMSSTSAANQYVGQLDDLKKIYNRVISAEEISSNYSEKKRAQVL